MTLLSFTAVTDPEKHSSYLGSVCQVDTHKLTIQVESHEHLRRAQVGQLVAVHAGEATEHWLIGLVDRITKNAIAGDDDESKAPSDALDSPAEQLEASEEHNLVRLTLVGTLRFEPSAQRYQFSRSIPRVPPISACCHVLREGDLASFMGILSDASQGIAALELGVYSMDLKAKALLDGNKFFQRHAALLGSTGSGKSWTVASLLEKANKLSSANLVVLDLHGEYRSLSYARHFRIPGPDELGKSDDALLFLPYWLLNAEELQSMFIDRSEFTAHNQVMAFQNAVIAEKQRTLRQLQQLDVLNAFTIDSPVPFDLDAVIAELKALNEEMVQGSKGVKQGNFYGQFGRLLTRLASKQTDKRYGFLFQAPPAEHDYAAMSRLVGRLLSFGSASHNIKVIDFSEVPSDILPVIVGLVARILYQIQFWTSENERHPFALVCDEAHLYLPKKEGQNPVERRAIETFEKIAKEGRKYGMSLLVVSQRPSDVSDTVLSQCNNVIALRLTNSADQDTVSKLMPESLKSILGILPILDIGEAVVVGDAVLLPTRIRITPPELKPISATRDFWTEWSRETQLPDWNRSVENMRRQGRNRAS